jgi:hypothetical protein
METLWNAVQQGGPAAWIILLVAIVAGIVVLRIVFELADLVVRVGCFVLFVLGVGWLIYTITRG